jgi:hypothetical protein
MEKMSGHGAGHHAKRNSMRGISPFERIPRVTDDRHPIDIAVENRLGDRVRQKWIVKLQERIIELLGAHSGLFLKLEARLNEQQRDRERCYFNIGYEHGVVDTHALARSGLPPVPPRAETLARSVQELMLQANLPAVEAILALLQCAWAMAETHRTTQAAPQERSKSGAQGVQTTL